MCKIFFKTPVCVKIVIRVELLEYPVYFEEMLSMFVAFLYLCPANYTASHFRGL